MPDDAPPTIGTDVPPFEFDSVVDAAWFIYGLMTCNEEDIKEDGACRHWKAINGLIAAAERGKA